MISGNGRGAGRGRGGPRPGAGRKPGSANKKTREIADRAAQEDITPLEVQLGTMREFWRRAHANGGEMDLDLAEKACQIARDCGPYIHARLSSVEAKIDTVNRLEVTVDVVRREGQILDIAFAELHLQRPKVVRAAEIVEPAVGGGAVDGG
jgi:hypothetical protein